VNYALQATDSSTKLIGDDARETMTYRFTAAQAYGRGNNCDKRLELLGRNVYRLIADSCG
jgi:hypothetical protein